MNDVIRLFVQSLCFVTAVFCLACDGADPEAKKEEILSPHKGDTWTYDVEIRSFLPASVPPLPASEKDNVSRESLEDGEVIRYTEKRVYLGDSRLESGEDVEVFGIYVGNTLARHEYSKIEGAQIYSIGMRQFYPEAKKAAIIKPRILLFDQNHKGGERWELKIEGPNGVANSIRDIRCIGWEEMVVLNRRQKVLHIELIGPGVPSFLSRDLWLLPGLGVVREELYRFTKDSLVLHERRVLREKLRGASIPDAQE